MKNIQLIKTFELSAATDFEKDKEVNQLFDGPFRKILEVRLQHGAVLQKHQANEPITVFCLSGTGVFSAGKNLEDSQDLHAGTFITLEGGVEHEVVAEPSLHIIVTKFKNS
jgi:quercetin dioxygenase-like cupin family protein